MLFYLLCMKGGGGDEDDQSISLDPDEVAFIA